MMWSFKKIVAGALLMLGASVWAGEYSPKLVISLPDKLWVYENGKKPVSYTDDEIFDAKSPPRFYPSDVRM